MEETKGTSEPETRPDGRARDRADWSAGLRRDIFSGGPAGCILVWICLSAVTGVAALIGREFYSAQAFNPGIGGALIVAIPAILAGYLVYKALSPVAALVAERMTSQRSRRVGWGVAIGFPVWPLLIVGLIRGVDRLQEPRRIATRLERECTEAVVEDQLAELSGCLSEARELQTQYPRRIGPGWLPKVHQSVSLAIQKGWPPIVEAALSHPKAYSQLHQSLESLSLHPLRFQLRQAAKIRLKELEQRGILVEFELIGDGNFIRQPAGTTVSKTRESFLSCLAAGTDRAIFYSQWPLILGSHEENGAATLKLSIEAETKALGLFEEEENPEIAVPVLAKATLTSSESELTFSTEELPLKDPWAYATSEAGGFEGMEVVPWPLEALTNARSQHSRTLFSQFCEQLKSETTGAWIESNLP